MRIISGKCRGRKLIPLKGMSIRPTTDRVRESIFNIISSWIGDARVLDLFAGTGAFGIECLSRGARCARFVDSARSSCDIIKKNIDQCGFVSSSSVLQFDASKPGLVNTLSPENYDIIFMDPPYERGFVEKMIKNSSIDKLCSDDALIIVEHSIKENMPDIIEKLDIRDQRQYGKTLISFLKRKDHCSIAS